jgi:ADP-heptose:LPS heptosyltransferase
MLTVEPEQVRRILVVKLSSLGDIVHVTPCVRALRHRFPHAHIVMAIDQCFADVVRCNPHLDGLIESDPRCSGWLARLLQTRHALSRHTRPRFDLAIDFQGVRRSALYVYLSHARLQGGRGGWRPGWNVVCAPRAGQHAVTVCADIAQALDIPVENLSPEVFLSEEADATVHTLLTSMDVPAKDFLLVNPFSRWRSKEWPLSRYADLIRRITHEWTLPVVLSGSRDRCGQAEQLYRLIGSRRVVSLVGRLTLAQALCLYQRAGVMVTGDSGPMHVAAALGTKLIALFGPTLPECTGPWGEGHRIIQERRPPTHHTYLNDDGGEYMRAIEVEVVYNAVAEVLADYRRRRRTA